MYIFKTIKLIDDYDISHLKLEIDERKLSYDNDILRFKFENDNKIFEKYKDCFELLDDTLYTIFIDKCKAFIDEYEEEQEKIKNELEKT